MSRVVAVVQARMTSTRLPGKVMRPLGDRTALAHLVGRLRRSARLDEVAVATSTDRSDDVVADAAAALGAAVVRGPLDDVLERYRLAAATLAADVVVRVTADCPAFDPHVLDAMLGTWSDADDYLNNVDPRRYPRGLDAEIIRREALEIAAADADRPGDREHVTPYLYRTRPERFRRRAFVPPGPDLSSFRWTLDTVEDAAFFDALLAAYGLGRFVSEVGHEPLAVFLSGRPEIVALNASVEQKALDTRPPGADG